jgi:hypothetical protein
MITVTFRHMRRKVTVIMGERVSVAAEGLFQPP